MINKKTERTKNNKSRFKKMAVQWLNEVQFTNGTFLQVENFLYEIVNYLIPQRAIHLFKCQTYL